VTGREATVELEIPSRSAYVAVVRLTVASLARQSGLDEQLVDDLRMAVSEACANAVIANLEAGVDAPVAVSWFEDDDRVVVEVADRGPVSAVETSEQPEDMSLALIRSLVDGCEFSPRPGGGMSTRLVISR
jgi:anti-sigma regulatory factor (Ser/Thr protein kinase)